MTNSTQIEFTFVRKRSVHRQDLNGAASTSVSCCSRDLLRSTLARELYLKDIE